MVPEVAQRNPVLGANVDAQQRAGHGIETGRKNQCIEVVVRIRGAQAGFCDLHDGSPLDVDQRHVVAVVAVEVARVGTQALGAYHVGGRQEIGHFGRTHDLANLAAHKVGSYCVGFLVGNHVIEGARETDAAGLPASLESLRELLRADIEDRLVGNRKSGHARRRFARRLAQLRVTAFGRVFIFGIQRRVAGRQAVIGSALEHMQVGGLLGDLGNQLDCRRAGSHHTHAQTGEVHRFVGPQAGVVGLSFEAVEPGDFWQRGGRQATGGHDAVTRSKHIALVGLDGPEVGVFVELRRHHTGFQLDPPFQVETLSHMVDITQYLRLCGIFFSPLPLLLEVVRKRVRVFEAFHVAAGARITIPEPGAADAGAGFEHLDVQAKFQKPVQHVEAGETGADHDHIAGG